LLSYSILAQLIEGQGNSWYGTVSGVRLSVHHPLFPLRAFSETT